ncbi:MAG: histidinol-phosphatase HisJ family protein [Clostridia bacterium]|nr:histidinol-phosphatase HisJ family protein [Clostridia bacterium]
MLSDTHTHTYYSADSKTDPEENIKKAVENGQKYIVLTDHFDHGLKCGKSDYNFDSLARADEIQRLKDIYASKITVLCGIETGQQPDEAVRKANDDKLGEYGFDYIIGSTHLIHGLDPYEGVYFEGKTMKEAYTELLRELIYNALLYDNYDSVGHFDYTSRYAPYENRTLRYRDFPDLLDAFFKIIISKGKALEFNTKTATRVEPDPDVWKRYRELGGELVTVGSDAHKPELVGLEFRRFGSFLKSCGFDYAFIYRGRKPFAEKTDQ